jgi:hypothetical protein
VLFGDEPSAAPTERFVPRIVLRCEELEEVCGPAVNRAGGVIWSFCGEPPRDMFGRARAPSSLLRENQWPGRKKRLRLRRDRNAAQRHRGRREPPGGDRRERGTG